MTPRLLVAAAALLALSSTQALAAAAAAPAAAPAPVTPPPGPPIPGVCVVSYERAVAESKAGAAFQARLQQLAAQVEAELNPERTAIQTEGQTLQTQRASLAQDVFAQRANALNAKIDTYSQKEQTRSAELDQTRQVNLQKIVAALNPIIVSLYTSERCSVVFEAQGLVAVNPAMDLTNKAVAQLDTRMPTITFERERAPAQAAAPAR